MIKGGEAREGGGGPGGPGVAGDGGGGGGGGAVGGGVVDDHAQQAAVPLPRAGINGQKVVSRMTGLIDRLIKKIN